MDILIKILKAINILFEVLILVLIEKDNKKKTFKRKGYVY